MWNVLQKAHRRRYLLLAGLILNVVLMPGCFNKTPQWNAQGTYHLGFLSPFDKSSSYPTGSSLPPVRVGLYTSGNQIANNAPDVLVSLYVYSDSTCTTPLDSNANSATTQKGIATINLGQGSGNTESCSDGGSDGPSPGTYYFKATATGVNSACSAAIVIGGSSSSAGMNLVVPIEMVDAGISSVMATASTFSTTQTRLDTNRYNGTVTYEFEVIARNGDTVPKNVYLEDSAPNTFASVSIPNGVANPTRYRVPFSTSPTGANMYSVRLDGTIGNNQLEVFAARIVVTQQQATRTQIYIPLLQGTASTATNTATPILSTSNTSFLANQAPINQTIWTSLSSAYSGIDCSSPFSLDVVLATTGGANASAALYDLTAGSMIGNAVTTPSATPSYQSTFLPLGSLISGNKYQVSAMTSNGGMPAHIYHAGLWIYLSNVTAAEIYNRVLGSYGSTSGPTQGYQFQILDLTQYSNPSVFFETTAYMSGSTTNISLATCGTNDFCTSPSPIGPTTAVSNVATPDRTRSATPLSVTSSDRFSIDISSSAFLINTAGSFAVIKTSK